MLKTIIAALLGASALAVGSAHAQTIGNAPDGRSIAAFGTPDTQTYGQVFTAPITGTLASFTLSLNGGVGSIFGAVDGWNGPAAWASGSGSSGNLYQSGVVPANQSGAFTFTPGISVVAGQRYVAYISTFGVPSANGTTAMPMGDNNDPFLNYFVFNNSTNPVGNSSWNHFSDFGDALFTATFVESVGAVPEPATWAMMIVGFGVAGVGLRRQRKVTTTVRFA